MQWLASRGAADFDQSIEPPRDHPILRYTAIMRILGIDCGSEYTGYGVVEEAPAHRLFCIAAGAIRLRPRDAMAVKLQHIYSQLSQLIIDHQPEMVAIEEVFYAVNVKSALKLGQVRGVAMLAASAAGLEVAEYSPLSIKSAVVGYGRAEKHQVQDMVMRLLNLPEPPEPADAADALALAICHIHTASTLKRYKKTKPQEITS
jgi:crossover junction endodeoxyribonuclease RuvC